VAKSAHQGANDSEVRYVILMCVYSHHDLETVEAFGLGALHLGRETLDKVLIHDTVGLGRGRRSA